jgi:hypothetical protein
MPKRTRLDQGTASRSPASRWVDAGFGLFLVVLAVVMLFAVEPQARAGAALVALVMIGLGIDGIVAAAGGRRSLLSRIGPLP